MELKDIRKNVDEIDAELLSLLSRRMEVAIRTRNFKGAITDSEREKEIFLNARARSKGLIYPEFAEKLFGAIVTESRRLQTLDSKLAGFQGEHGAYSEQAVRSRDASWIPIPCQEFSEVFDGVRDGAFDIGVVPVENSIEGSVNQVNDLLVERDLYVIGEVRVPVKHCLLTLPNTDFREIKRVYSHPQALGQCRGFISRNKLDARPFYDTAGAAAMLSREKPDGAAAIASALCAEIYNLEIIKEGIEDHEFNSTRFVVIAREPRDQSGNKCSIIFSTVHRAGALYEVLKIFSDAGINLTRIESRPVRKDPGTFAFLLDFMGSDKDPKVTAALDEAKQHSAMFKYLGSYSEG